MTNNSDYIDPQKLRDVLSVGTQLESGGSFISIFRGQLKSIVSHEDKYKYRADFNSGLVGHAVGQLLSIFEESVIDALSGKPEEIDLVGFDSSAEFYEFMGITEPELGIAKATVRDALNILYNAFDPYAGSKREGHVNSDGAKHNYNSAARVNLELIADLLALEPLNFEVVPDGSSAPYRYMFEHTKHYMGLGELVRRHVDEELNETVAKLDRLPQYFATFMYMEDMPASYIQKKLGDLRPEFRKALESELAVSAEEREGQVVETLLTFIEDFFPYTNAVSAASNGISAAKLKRGERAVKDLSSEDVGNHAIFVREDSPEETVMALRKSALRFPLNTLYNLFSDESEHGAQKRQDIRDVFEAFQLGEIKQFSFEDTMARMQAFQNADVFRDSHDWAAERQRFFEELQKEGVDLESWVAKSEQAGRTGSGFAIGEPIKRETP